MTLYIIVKKYIITLVNDMEQIQFLEPTKGILFKLSQKSDKKEEEFSDKLNSILKLK